MKNEMITNLKSCDPAPSSPLCADALPNGFNAIQSSPLPDGGAEEEQDQQRFLPASVTALDHKLRGLNNHTRIGKIARLRYEVREMVNGMLRGGLRYIDIVARLRKQGYTHINENNLSFWKSGGYLDWLDHQHQRES